MKEHLESPDHYERMVKLLVEYNPLFVERGGIDGAEEEARHIINICIRGALQYGDSSTGCCHATKTSYGKVRLFLDPLIP